MCRLTPLLRRNVVVVDGLLQTACNDMRRQKEETDVALARRIDETRDAKEKLEAHLAKVRQSYYHTRCLQEERLKSRSLISDQIQPSRPALSMLGL